MRRKRVIAGVVGAAVLAGSLSVVAVASAADPVMYSSSTTMVATEVSDYAAAEKAAKEAAIAAQEAWNNDMSGIGASAYTGEYYDPAYEATRQCIVNKESGGNYAVVSGNGMYHGAYQFSQATADTAAVKMGRPDLVGVPPEQWNRYEQDMAFWVTWNHGAGRGNWPTAAGC